MNHLAASNTETLKFTQFNMASFFFTDTFAFKKITLSEKTLYTCDALFAVLLLVLLSPIMLLVAAAISITMGGNVFYTQVRVGKNGKLFKIVKFRSMVQDAEEKSGPVLSSIGDTRVTPLGKFLRASHLDELPQLFNVIVGDMSFIGPRPERPEFVDIYEKDISNYNRRATVKPGITGLAQICLPYDATPAEKLDYDLYFIDHKESVLFLLLINYYTALKMVTFHKNQ